MATTIVLSASAAFGMGGKQFVARITGRHSKYTFEYEFLGRKEGKRGESTSVRVDEPGLYIERDVNRKAAVSDTFYLIWRDGEEVRHWVATKAQAMGLAKEIEAGADPTALAVREIIRESLEIIAEHADKDPEEPVEVSAELADYAGLTYGERIPRREIIAARARIVERLAGAPCTAHSDCREHAADMAPACTAAALDLSLVTTESLVAELTRRGFVVVGKPELARDVALRDHLARLAVQQAECAAAGLSPEEMFVKKVREALSGEGRDNSGSSVEVEVKP